MNIPTFTKQEYKEDISFIKSKIFKLHPNPYKFISKESLEKEFEDLEESCNTNEDFILGLRKIFHKIGDSHTGISGFWKLIPQEGYPIEIKYLNTGYYIVKAEEQSKDYIGKKIIKVNGIDISEIEERLREYIAYENDIKLRMSSIWFLIEPLFLKAIGIDSERLEIMCEDGTVLEVDKKVISDNQLYSPRDDIVKPYTLDFEGFYKTKYFKDISTFYFQYNECDYIKKKEFQKIVKDIKECKSKYVVIDMRHNIGGSSYLLSPVLSYLEKKNKDIVAVVFTSEITFSSAVINTLELTDIPNSISFGFKTSGAPTKFGEPDVFVLPNSKLGFKVSRTIFDEDDYAFGNPYVPDIEVVLNVDDYLNCHDVVWDRYLNWIKDR